MTVLSYVAVFVIGVVVSGFAFYWAGRNAGESTMYAQQRVKQDRMREQNYELRLEVARLQGLTGYSGEEQPSPLRETPGKPYYPPVE